MTDTDMAVDTDSKFYEICGNSVSAIKRDQNHDAELLTILTSHIIVPDPDAEAIKQSAANIKELAERRAQT